MKQILLVYAMRIVVFFIICVSIHISERELFLAPLLTITAIWEYVLIYNRNKKGKHPKIKTNYCVFSDVLIWSAVSTYFIFANLSAGVLGSLANLANVDLLIYLSIISLIGLLINVVATIFCCFDKG